MSGRRYRDPGPQGNGHGRPVDPRIYTIRGLPQPTVPLIGQPHQVQLALGTSDGQPPTVIELVSAIAQLVLQVTNLESDTDALSEGRSDQAAMLGDVEATLAVMRGACAFRRVLLEQRVALAERKARREAQSKGLDKCALPERPPLVGPTMTEAGTPIPIPPLSPEAVREALTGDDEPPAEAAP